MEKERTKQRNYVVTNIIKYFLANPYASFITNSFETMKSNGFYLLSNVSYAEKILS